MGLKYWPGTTTISILSALNIEWARAPVLPLFLQSYNSMTRLVEAFQQQVNSSLEMKMFV